MKYKDTVEVRDWIGVHINSKIYIWYHSEIEEVQQVLDLLNVSTEKPLDMPIPVTPEGKFLMLNNKDLMLIGGYTIDLN